MDTSAESPAALATMNGGMGALSERVSMKGMLEDLPPSRDEYSRLG